MKKAVSKADFPSSAPKSPKGDLLICRYLMNLPGTVLTEASDRAEAKYKTPDTASLI